MQMETASTLSGNRERKSIRLEKLEMSTLKKYVSGFKAIVEAAEVIGIHRNVLDRVLLAGSGSPATVAKIRSAISVETSKVA